MERKSLQRWIAPLVVTPLVTGLCVALFIALGATVEESGRVVASDVLSEEDAAVKDRSLELHLRSQKEVKEEGNALENKKATEKKFVAVESTELWDPSKAALIVVDMWDDHWCKGAAQRVTEMAGPMDKVIANARERGMFIIHAPSTTVDFYNDTPQRKLAQQAKFAKTPVPLSTVERWGTAWCYPVPDRESPLPIDDSDMGCDCQTKCEIVPPWKRQIATITIAPQDAITDNGQELWNLLEERKIDNVLIMGVHLNMCVLGRPFAIRQLKMLGKNVVLVRDMTDTMYNSKMPPFVNHFSGTDLVIEHVERNWCPTILSTDLVGGVPFKFKEDTREQTKDSKSSQN